MSALQHNPREGFLVGEMLAQYGHELPGDADEAMRQGYASFPAARKNPAKLADRYVRKYLQVRINAWRRNRIVDDSFTVQMLRKIDNERCPVSGVVLTHGTGEDTDWSVDRLDNNKGYILGNVVIVSSRVNHAKGALGPESIYPRALARKDCDGLTGDEWLRLGYLVNCTLMDAASEAAALPLPFALEQTPVGLAWPFWAVFEVYLAYACIGYSATNREGLWNGITQSGASRTAISAVHLRECIAKAIRGNKAFRENPLELFQDPEVWNAFSIFWPLYKKTKHCVKTILYCQDMLRDVCFAPGCVKKLNIQRCREQEQALGYC